MSNLCPSCKELLNYPSGEGCATMTKHKEKTMTDQELIERLRNLATNMFQSGNWGKDLDTTKAAEARLKQLADELHTMKTGGIIEVADRNNRVTEYMFYWEGRALEAEAKLEESEANLAKAINLLHRHCDPWGMNNFDATTLAELTGNKHE